MLLALLCVGIFLIQLDVTVVNVALPAVRADLGTSLSGQQWVVAAYMIALAGLLLVFGMLGDRIGHRRVVLAGLGVFGVASLACGVAPTIELLVAARAVQGVGAALLLPGTLAVISDLYVDSAARARAVGIWSGAGALALPSGPLLGGALVSALGWRAVFLINLPIIAVAFPLAWRLVPQRQIEQERAKTRLRIGASFVGPNVIAGLMNFVGLGTVLVLTLYLQEHLSQKAFRAGLELIPLFLPLAALGPITGRITARYGPRLPMTIGLAFGVVGSAFLLGVDDRSGYAAVVPVQLGLGLGMGFLTAALVHAAIAALPPDRAGLASGVNNTSRQAVGALGVGVYGATLGHAPSFVSGLHVLGWLGAGLWTVALGITWLTVE
ncbi:MFS transporter [Kribbella speibonae]|uniref:MFS transporter n=1 Tax=Kribbella speibonae TaxID=1572660 RepID=A0ABY2A216_9ACTN|nr:MFS transporter [Kribbella speibonae]TCC20948.1 MFS transporter [Kribbella speibonae]